MPLRVQAKRYDSVQELHELSKADGIEDDGSLVGQLIRSVAMQGNVRDSPLRWAPRRICMLHLVYCYCLHSQFESALEQLTTASKDAAVKVFLPAYSGLVLYVATLLLKDFSVESPT